MKQARLLLSLVATLEAEITLFERRPLTDDERRVVLDVEHQLPRLRSTVGRILDFERRLVHVRVSEHSSEPTPDGVSDFGPDPEFDRADLSSPASAPREL
jgi:hypothetical protein